MMEFNHEKHNELIRSLKNRNGSFKIVCDCCNKNRVMILGKGSASKCTECYNKLIKSSRSN